MGKPETVFCTNDLEKCPTPHKKHDQDRNGARATSLPKAYFEKVVKPRVRHQPGFEHLQQFMDPEAEGFQVGFESRILKFDIVVVQFAKSENPPSVSRCSTLDDLECVLAEDKDVTGTVLIAEDISRAMIEALGTRFELPPEFFANHLVGTELYRTGRHESPAIRPPARSLNLLPDYLRAAPFYTVEHRRPFHVEGGIPEVIRRRAFQTNTPRGAMLIHPNLSDLIVSEKISVYKSRGAAFGKAMILVQKSNEVLIGHQELTNLHLYLLGIILTDSLFSDVPPSSHIPHQITSIDKDAHSLGPHGHWLQLSSRQELISWIQHLPSHEVNSIFNDDEPLALRPVLKIVESSQLVFLAHARYIMNRVLVFDCDDTFPDSIPFFLHISRSLSRIMHEQGRILRCTLRVASFRGGDKFAEQQKDLGHLAEDVNSMLKALQEDVRSLVGEASIREGRIVGWVSKFAALFLPVSLLATILSISETGYLRWAILGGLSIPFVVTLVYFLFLWKPAGFSGLRL